MEQRKSVVATIWCRACGVGCTLRLLQCPACGALAQWAAECPVPLVRWLITRDDAVFLRVQKIDPERSCEP